MDLRELEHFPLSANYNLARLQSDMREAAFMKLIKELENEDVHYKREFFETGNRWLDNKQFMIIFFDPDVIDNKKTMEKNVEAVKASIAENIGEHTELDMSSILSGDMDATQLVSLHDQTVMEQLASRTIVTVMPSDSEFANLSFADAQEAPPVEVNVVPKQVQPQQVQYDAKILEKLAKLDKNIKVLTQQEEIFSCAATNLQNTAAEAAEAFESIANEIAVLSDQIKMTHGFVENLYKAKMQNLSLDRGNLFNVLEQLQVYVDAQNRIRAMKYFHMTDKKKNNTMMQNMLLKTSKENVGGMQFDAMLFLRTRIKALSSQNAQSAKLKMFYSGILRMEDVASYNIFGNDVFLIRENTSEKSYFSPLPTMWEHSYRKFVMEQ